MRENNRGVEKMGEHVMRGVGEVSGNDRRRSKEGLGKQGEGK